MNELMELKINDTEVGSGAEVKKGAIVICHYTGLLEDGTKFDSSLDRGTPFQFVIGTGRVIKGWDLGIIGMKEGGKRTLFVPAHLAYGERSVGALIAANSNLIFHVELIEARNRE